MRRETVPPVTNKDNDPWATPAPDPFAPKGPWGDAPAQHDPWGSESQNQTPEVREKQKTRTRKFGVDVVKKFFRSEAQKAAESNLEATYGRLREVNEAGSARAKGEFPGADNWGSLDATQQTHAIWTGEQQQAVDQATDDHARLTQKRDEVQATINRLEDPNYAWPNKGDELGKLRKQLSALEGDTARSGVKVSAASSEARSLRSVVDAHYLGDDKKADPWA